MNNSWILELNSRILEFDFQDLGIRLSGEERILRPLCLRVFEDQEVQTTGFQDRNRVLGAEKMP